MRTAPAIALITALAALSSIGDTPAAGNVVAVPPAEYRPTQAAPKAAVALVAPDAPLFRLALPVPTEVERESLKAMNAKRAEPQGVGRRTSAKSRALAIGYPRELAPATRTVVLSDLAWKALPDGRDREDWIQIYYPGVPGSVGWVWALQVGLSPGALLPFIDVPATPSPVSTPTINPTLEAAFIGQLTATRLPTFTPPPPLDPPSFSDEPAIQRGGIPIGLLIVSLALFGFFGAVISYLRGR